MGWALTWRQVGTVRSADLCQFGRNHERAHRGGSERSHSLWCARRKDESGDFSDEKNFNQDQKVNSKNNRWLCDDPTEVPIVMQTKFPATVMTLAVVSNKGDVMPPHFFEAGLKINTDVYIEVLSNVVKPWMEQVAAGRPYIWQQDGAPAHNSNKTQQWCRDNLPFFFEKEIWPPSSPDCNPLDYFVWGVTERDVNRSSHNTKQALMDRIKEVFASLPRDDVVKACSRFRSRIEKVVAANGDFFE